VIKGTWNRYPTTANAMSNIIIVIIALSSFLTAAVVLLLLLQRTCHLEALLSYLCRSRCPKWFSFESQVKSHIKARITMAAVAAVETPAANSKGGRQIPIVCPGHTRPLTELQFCNVQEEDRTFLISACHDRMPMVRDGSSGDWIGTFSGHKGAVWSCRMDPKGLLAATASGDFSVKVWDAITGISLWEFPHKHIVKCVDFSADSKRLATVGHEGLLRIYTLPDTEPQVIKQDPSKKVIITKCNWWKDNVVLAAGNDGVIRFWDLTNPEKPVAFLKVDAEVRDMEISADQTILTVAAGKKVSFFDLNTKELIHSYPMPIHFREVCLTSVCCARYNMTIYLTTHFLFLLDILLQEGGASLHPSKTKFVAGGSDLWVRVFDFETGKELECHKGHHGPIRCVRYAPDGKTYATGSEDGTIRLWKTDALE